MDNKDINQEIQAQIADFREVGASGLRRFSGFIFEEILQELTGWKGVAIYKEMSTNDATVSAILFAIKMLSRRAPWKVEPASTLPEDQEAAEFLETCMEDMSQTWIDMVDEALSMLEYGYSVHEIVYKRRCGDVFDPTMRSKFSDGRIGWRKLPIRSQDTIYRWQFDDHGGIQGVEQLAPPHYYHVTIPIEKMLLFRTTIVKNNPEGKSALRGAYRAWYMKKFIENIEGIGVERDLAGLPVALVPPEIMSTNASQGQKNLLAGIKDIIINIRRDAQEGVIFPQAFDTNGKPMYELKLLNSAGSRQFDTNQIINRWDQRIAMSLMSDFLLLGQEKVGSFALSSSKTNLFADAVGAYLDQIANVFNQYAIPRLFALNDFKITNLPKIVHGELQAKDPKEVGEYFRNLAMAGAPLFPNPELEKWVLNIIDAPEPPEPVAYDSNQMNPSPSVDPNAIAEIPGLPIQTPTGLAQPQDTTPVNGKPPVTQVVTNQTGNTETNAFTDNQRITEDSLRDIKRINSDY